MRDKSSSGKRTEKEWEDLHHRILELEGLVKELKHEKEKPKTSEERHRGLVEGLRDVIYRMSIPDGEYQYLSPACERVFGYTVEEFMLNPVLIRDIIHPDFMEYFQEKWADLLDGKIPPTYEYKTVDPEGGERWILQSNTGIYDEGGKIVAIEGLCRDITAVKEVESALRESEERYRTLYSTMSEGMALHDIVYGRDGEAVDYIIVDINPAFEAIVGIKRSEAVGSTASELYGSGEPPYLEIYAEVASSGTPVTFEPYFQPMDKHFHISVFSPRRGTFATLFSDITAMKKTEIAYRESERRFEAFMKYLPLCAFLKDADGRFLYLNEYYEKAFDINREDWLGKSDGQIWPSEVAERLRADDLSVLNSGEILQRVEEIPHIDGTHVYLTLKFPLSGAGGGDMLAGVAMDVTDRVRMEEELKREREQLISLFDSINEVIYVADPETYEVIYANKYLKDAFGEEMVGGICYREFQGFEEPCPFCTNDIILENKGETYQWEYHNTKLNMDFLITDRIIKWPDGRDVRFELAIDITERTQAEEELRRYRDHLEEMVEERTVELADVNAELESFAYSVSHDLRAPLRAMQGFSLALMEDYTEDLDETGKDYAQRIVTASRRMDVLICDLLSYSRLSRSEIKMEAVNTEEIVADVLEQLGEEIAGRDGLVEVEERLPRVLGSRTVLLQVMENLVSNAIRFTVPKAKLRVRIWAEERDGTVRLWVEDNGIGIAPRYQERIFHIFERLHGVEAYPGTGIGLAIVRKGMERMGGRVGVESEEGRGSRFWIELPAGEREA